MSTEDYAAPIDLMMPNRIQHEMHMSESMLRDYFAAKAMQGIESNSAKDYSPADLAQQAYAIADAMLAERSKP